RGLPLLLLPHDRPDVAITLMLVRRQQPLHIRPRELDGAALVAERVDARLDVRLHRPPLGQKSLPILVNLRLGAPIPPPLEPFMRLRLRPVFLPRLAVVSRRAMHLIAHGYIHGYISLSCPS